MSSAPAARAPARVRVAALFLALAAACTDGVDDSSLPGRSTDVPPAAPTTTTLLTTSDPAIEELMTGAGMTPLGRSLFLGTEPVIEDAASLRESCGLIEGAGSTTAHTFGCLIDGRIHVRAFTDPRVRELMYVVAAHELLHVAYSQLTTSRRTALDAELDAARGALPLLEERLAVYAEAAEDTLSEVHSIVGTEFENLSATLEAHYSDYFDRGLVIGAYRRSIGDRESEIRALKTSIADMEARLDELWAELAALEEIGDFAGYDATVARYNALVEEHNEAVARVNALVDEDNRLTGP